MESNEQDAAKEAENLESLVNEHPFYLEAKGQPWCSGPEVFLFSKADVLRMRTDETLKRKIASQLHSPESRARVLMFCTSQQEHEAMSGHGHSYAFFFHPKRDELMAIDRGTWKS